MTSVSRPPRFLTPRAGYMGCKIWNSQELLVCRMIFFSCGEWIFPHHVQRSTTVDNVHPVLRLYDRFGRGCVRFLDRRVALDELRVLHVRVSILIFAEVFVEFLRCVSCLIYLILCPNSVLKPASSENWDSCGAIDVFYNVTTLPLGSTQPSCPGLTDGTPVALWKLKCSLAWSFSIWRTFREFPPAERFAVISEAYLSFFYLGLGGRPSFAKVDEGTIRT